MLARDLSKAYRHPGRILLLLIGCLGDHVIKIEWGREKRSAQFFGREKKAGRGESQKGNRKKRADSGHRGL